MTDINISNFHEKQLIPNDATLSVKKQLFYPKEQKFVNLMVEQCLYNFCV